jgi:hypothetical protein
LTFSSKCVPMKFQPIMVGLNEGVIHGKEVSSWRYRQCVD